MKKNATSLVCILALTIGLQAEQPKEMKPHKGSAELEKIKSLVGTWVGEMKHGDKTMPTSVSYKLTGGGSAVVETWNEGTPMEMVSGMCVPSNTKRVCSTILRIFSPNCTAL